MSVVCLVHVDQSALMLKESGFFEHQLEPLTQEQLQQIHQQQQQQQVSNAENQQRYQTTPQVGSRKKIYAPNAVPAVHNASGLNIGELQYELGRIAHFARRLQEHTQGVLEARALASTEAARKMASLCKVSVDSCVSSSQLSALRLDPGVVSAAAAREVTFSAEVCERSFARGVGEFSAFKDGRTKARFVDRCLAELNASRSLMNLLLPNGFTLQLSLPLEDERDQRRYQSAYVAPLLEFAAFAFQTPAERVEQHRRDAMQREFIALQVEQTRREMALKRIARGQEQPLLMPPAPTPAAGALHSSTVHCTPRLQLRSAATSTPVPFPQLMPPLPSDSAHCSPPRVPADADAPLPAHSTLSPHFSLLSPISATPLGFAAAAPFVTDSTLSITQSSFAPQHAQGTPASPSVADLSYWIADLQSRNREVQQRLANSSRSIQAAIVQ